MTNITCAGRLQLLLQGDRAVRRALESEGRMPILLHLDSMKEDKDQRRLECLLAWWVKTFAHLLAKQEFQVHAALKPWRVRPEDVSERT